MCALRTIWFNKIEICIFLNAIYHLNQITRKKCVIKIVIGKLFYICKWILLKTKNYMMNEKSKGFSNEIKVKSRDNSENKFFGLSNKLLIF